ncbi:MAG: hypothetical protein J07HX64_02008 [halophilic archaeon J07HX64]|nr:MAG: hypothetical protein J07HX64_02008 [halophilic archaeon J07HX64]
MDRSQDTDGESGSGRWREYGHVALARRTDGSGDVPRSAGEYVGMSGDHPVPTSHERIVRVAEISEHVDGPALEGCPRFHTVVGGLREAEHCPYRTGSGGIQ